MRYYIDTGVDGFRGPLISMAMVREDGRSVYFVMEGMDRPRALGGKVKNAWVVKNVLPVIRDCPEMPWIVDARMAGLLIAEFIEHDPEPILVADFPDDFKHVCDLLHISAGFMPPTAPVVRFELHRVHPPSLPGHPAHNAWADAVALGDMLSGDA